MLYNGFFRASLKRKTPESRRRERFNIESRNFSKAIFYGLTAIFIVIVVSSLIFSLILRFSSVQESSLQYVVTAFSFAGLFIGGFISGGKGKQKGWLMGGATGLSYSSLVFMFQYLGYDNLFSFEQLIYHICFILICMMGGILGVNMTSSSRNE